MAGEPQAIDGNGVDHDSLLYNKIWDSYVALEDSRINEGPFDELSRLTHKDDPIGNQNPPCGIADLENLEFDTPLGSQQLSVSSTHPSSIGIFASCQNSLNTYSSCKFSQDLSFGSQDSSWLDHF